MCREPDSPTVIERAQDVLIGLMLALPMVCGIVALAFVFGLYWASK